MIENLKPDRPICFFDIESTGISTAKDRIVELHILKLFLDGTKKSKTWRVNPSIPIPAEVSRIHGITDEDVADCPAFADIVSEVLAMIEGADLAGYNSYRFDLPMLAEEILRTGNEDFDLKACRSIDVQVIYHKKERRNLTAAYRFYCDKELKGAHDARADVEATCEVFQAQLQKYTDLPDNSEALSQYTKQTEFADFAGFLTFDDQREIVINFGKNKGKKIKWLAQHDTGYLDWVLRSDFPLYTKNAIKKFFKRKAKSSKT